MAESKFIWGEDPEYDGTFVHIPGQSQGPFSSETSTFDTRRFISPPGEDGREIQSGIIRRVFGLAEDAHAGLILTLQIVISMAMLEVPPLVRDTYEDNVSYILYCFGMVIAYAKRKGNVDGVTEDNIEHAFSTGIFGDRTPEKEQNIRQGFEWCNQCENTDDPHKGQFYRRFNLERTLETFADGDTELCGRIQPVLEAVKAVLGHEKIEIPEHVPFNADDEHFVLRLFHAPRMAIGYVNCHLHIALACVAIQFYKNIEARTGEYSFNQLFPIDMMLSMCNVNYITHETAEMVRNRLNGTATHEWVEDNPELVEDNTSDEYPKVLKTPFPGPNALGIVQDYLSTAHDVMINCVDIPMVLSFYKQFVMHGSAYIGYEAELHLDDYIHEAMMDIPKFNIGYDFQYGKFCVVPVYNAVEFDDFPIEYDDGTSGTVQLPTEVELDAPQTNGVCSQSLKTEFELRRHLHSLGIVTTPLISYAEIKDIQDQYLENLRQREEEMREAVYGTRYQSHPHKPQPKPKEARSKKDLKTRRYNGTKQSRSHKKMTIADHLTLEQKAAVKLPF